MVAVKEIALRRLLHDKAQKRLRPTTPPVLHAGAQTSLVRLRWWSTTRTCNVVLELAENGSLASLVKPTKFGVRRAAGARVRPANTAGSRAVLAGVGNRDVKGANVLTTKDGVVKIADFGVALRRSIDLDTDDTRTGIIRLIWTQGYAVLDIPGGSDQKRRKAVDSASDVWVRRVRDAGVAHRRAPYFDMQPMPAMFAIVNNDKRPPLPNGVSAECRDFLKRCFQERPRETAGRAEMRAHAWLAVDPINKPRRSAEKKKNSDDRKREARRRREDAIFAHVFARSVSSHG